MKTKTLPILPCPFCGQAAKVCRQSASLPEIRATYWQCGCGDTHRTRLCAVHPLAFGDTRAEAITTWNTRAPNPKAELAFAACRSITFATANAVRHGGDYSLNDLLAADKLARAAIRPTAKKGGAS